MEEKQETEVGIAMFEVYYIEIAALARSASINMVEKT